MDPYILSLNLFSGIFSGLDTFILYLVVLALISIIFAALIAGLSRSPGGFKYIALVIFLVLAIMQLEGIDIAGIFLNFMGSL
jgi:hypothetical protein